MVQVVSRAEWGASAPLGPPMRLPVSEMWLHHSVTPLTDDPAADMKAIERIGVARFGRFSYSWAYHARHRLLLEGAGNTVGAHTAGRNSTSLGLVLIGNYESLYLSDDNVADLGWIIAWLISGNRLRPDVYPTGGHRDLKATACPGDHAYARIADIRATVPPQEDDMPITDDDAKKIARAVIAELDLTVPPGQNDFRKSVYDTFAAVADLAATPGVAATTGTFQVTGQLTISDD